jgi:hypothetical protein
MLGKNPVILKFKKELLMISINPMLKKTMPRTK